MPNILIMLTSLYRSTLLENMINNSIIKNFTLTVYQNIRLCLIFPV